MPNALYICYFGIREPLVQTQVLPYLRELVKGDVRMSLLTFEPASEAREFTSARVTELRGELREQGIAWHWVRYHKRLSVIATAWDIFRGTIFIRGFIGREQIDLLHGRVHVPTLMGALARKFSRRKPKLLFDIRGFFPEEYTDAGVWSENGWLYRTAKRVEKWLLKEADGFVVLTERAKQIMFGGSAETGISNLRSEIPVEVIPCCVDSRRFDNALSRDEARRRLGVEARFVVAYVGSFGGWYLTDEMMDLFAAAREFCPRTFVLILTQRDTEKVVDLLLHRGFGADDFLVKTVEPQELADYLVAGDVAVSFIKACYSKLSSSPTKIAEYLACGVPIIANRGVGDLDRLIEDSGTGLLLQDFSQEQYVRALNTIGALGDVREACRETAARNFDLETVGGPRYKRIYNVLLDPIV